VTIESQDIFRNNDLDELKVFIHQNLNSIQSELYIRNIHSSKMFSNKRNRLKNGFGSRSKLRYLVTYFYGLFYIVIKKFQYLPYRCLKKMEYENNKLFWVGPTYRIEEFEESYNTTTGSIWGSVKFIDNSIESSCYVLIPYLDKSFKNHFQQAKKIYNLNKKMKFRIYPIAASLDNLTILKVLKRYHKCAQNNYSIISKLYKQNSRINLTRHLDCYLNGRDIAEVLLNEELISNFANSVKISSFLFANCEGQPWEISLRYSNFFQKNILLHLVFSLPDSEKNCNLTNHLLFPIKDNIKILTGFRENLAILKGISSKHEVVEPQRFITVNPELKFKASIKNVIYFCDLNDDRTLNFFKLVEEFCKFNQKIKFGVKLHPASKRKNLELNSSISVVKGDFRKFDPDTFIFGANTSSIFQSEYRLIRKFIFNENQQELSANQVSYGFTFISTAEDLRFYLDSGRDFARPTPILDSSLKQWKQVVANLLNSKGPI